MSLHVYSESFQVATSGRGTVEITDQVQGVVDRAQCLQGLVSVFVHHTSASLILCENADPSVRRDLEGWFARSVPDGDAAYTHTLEGPDDMPAHIRSVLTHPGLVLPFRGGELDLGTWQGVFLYEHRRRGQRRRVTVTVLGE